MSHPNAHSRTSADVPREFPRRDASSFRSGAPGPNNAFNFSGNNNNSNIGGGNQNGSPSSSLLQPQQQSQAQQQQYIVMTPQMLQMLLQQQQQPQQQPLPQGSQAPLPPPFFPSGPGNTGSMPMPSVQNSRSPPPTLPGQFPSSSSTPFGTMEPPSSLSAFASPGSSRSPNQPQQQPQQPPMFVMPHDMSGFMAPPTGPMGQPPMMMMPPPPPPPPPSPPQTSSTTARCGHTPPSVPSGSSAERPGSPNYNPFSTSPATAMAAFSATGPNGGGSPFMGMGNSASNSTADVKAPSPMSGVPAYYLTEADARRMGLLNPTAPLPPPPPPLPAVPTRGGLHTTTNNTSNSSSGAVGGNSYRGAAGSLSMGNGARQGLPPPPPAESLLSRVTGTTSANISYLPPSMYTGSAPLPPPPLSTLPPHLASAPKTALSATPVTTAAAAAHEAENGSGFVVGGWYEGVVKRYNPQRGYGFIKGVYRLAFDAQDCEEVCTAYVEDDRFMKGLVPHSQSGSVSGGSAGHSRTASDAGIKEHLCESKEQSTTSPSPVPATSADATGNTTNPHERGAAVLSTMQWYLHTKIGSNFPDDDTHNKSNARDDAPASPLALLRTQKSPADVKPGELMDSCSPWVKRVRLPPRGCDIFIHHSCISLDNFRALPTYTPVRFCVAEVMGTVQAVDVVPLGPMWCRKTLHLATLQTTDEDGKAVDAQAPSHVVAGQEPVSRTTAAAKASLTALPDDKAAAAEGETALAQAVLLPPLCTISPEAQELLQRHQALAALARTAGPAAATTEAHKEDDQIRHCRGTSPKPDGTPKPAANANTSAPSRVRAVLPSAAIPNALQSLSELDATDAAPSAVFADWRYPAKETALKSVVATTITTTKREATANAKTDPALTATQQKLQAELANKQSRDGTNSGEDGLTSAAGMTSSKNVTSSASPTATGSGGGARTISTGTNTQDKNSSSGLPTSGTDPTTGSSGNGSGPQNGSSEEASGAGAANTSSKPDTDSGTGRTEEQLSPRAAAALHAIDRSDPGIASLSSSVPPSAVMPTSSGAPAIMCASLPPSAAAGADGVGHNNNTTANGPAGLVQAAEGGRTAPPTPHHRHRDRGEEAGRSATAAAAAAAATAESKSPAGAKSPKQPQPQQQRRTGHKHQDGGNESEGSSSSGSGGQGSGSSGGDTGKTVTSTTLSSNTIPDSIPGEIADWTDVFEAKMANERAKDILLHKKDIRFFPHQSAAAKEAAEAAAAAAALMGGNRAGASGISKLPATEIIPLSAVGELDSSSSRGVENDGGSQQELRRSGRSRGASRSRGGSRQRAEDEQLRRRPPRHGSAKSPQQQQTKKHHHHHRTADDDDDENREERRGSEGTPTSSTHDPNSDTTGNEHGGSGGIASNPDTGPSQISDARTNESSGRAGGLPPLVMVPVARLPAKLARQVPEGVPLIALPREMAEKLGISLSGGYQSTDDVKRAAAAAAGTTGSSGRGVVTHRTPGPVGHLSSKRKDSPLSGREVGSPVYGGSAAGGTSGYGSSSSPGSIGPHPARFVFDFKANSRNEVFSQNSGHQDGTTQQQQQQREEKQRRVPLEASSSDAHGGMSTSPLPTHPDHPSRHFKHSVWPTAAASPVRPASMWAQPTPSAPGSLLGVSGHVRGAASASSAHSGPVYAHPNSVAQLGDVQYSPTSGAMLNGHRLPLFNTPRERRPIHDIALPQAPWEQRRNA